MQSCVPLSCLHSGTEWLFIHFPCIHFICCVLISSQILGKALPLPFVHFPCFSLPFAPFHKMTSQPALLSTAILAHPCQNSSGPFFFFLFLMTVFLSVYEFIQLLPQAME